MSNGGNTELGIKSTNFKGIYIELSCSLDFFNIFSYSNYLSEKYGDLNGDGVIENIKLELTKKSGFTPIAYQSGYFAGNTGKYASFQGYFNGKNNEIKNIYVYTKGTAGLFGSATEKIENLVISGHIESTDFASRGNCWNYIWRDFN